MTHLYKFNEECDYGLSINNIKNQIKNFLFCTIPECWDIYNGKTKDRLIKILKDLSNEYTVVLISHDLNVIKKADKIFLLDEGKVIVKGEHYKLLENNFTYKSLFADELVV